MRIYIAGSCRDPKPDVTASFLSACKAIGAHLAAEGHSFVLGSREENTADYGVRQGILDYGKSTSAKPVPVTLILRDYDSDKSPEGQNDLETFFPKKYFLLKKERVKAGGNHARLIAGLPHSDVVLLICGASGTYTIGVAAVAMKHPLLALPQFGGTAEQTWQVLVPLYARQTFSKSEIDLISRAWDESSPKIVADALATIQKNNPLVDRVELNQIFLSAAALLLILLWMMVFPAPQRIFKTYMYSFFLLTALASTLGSLSRNIVKCYFDRTSLFSLSRFISEAVLGIVVTFVLYLLLQVGAVVVSGQKMTPAIDGYDQFSRMTLAMSLLGFAASFLIEISLDRVRGRLAGFLDETTGGSK